MSRKFAVTAAAVLLWLPCWAIASDKPAEHAASSTKSTSKATAAKPATIKPAGKSAAAAHWSYEGEAGPENWGKLDPGYGLCASGRNQSPVNVAGAVEGELVPLVFNYKAGGNEVINNGHTIQVSYAASSTLTVDGTAFELKQFHFHAPSENTIDGKSFPMELHLVHADAEGNLAVVGVMIQEGKWNKEVSKAWMKMPTADEKQPLGNLVDANGLLPASRDYYRFSGSLTTPPCSEGVRWLLMKNPITVEKAQIKLFADTMHHHTNRPVQPVYGRLIVQ